MMRTNSALVLARTEIQTIVQTSGMVIETMHAQLVDHKYTHTYIPSWAVSDGVKRCWARFPLLAYSMSMYKHGTGCPFTLCIIKAAVKAM